jgi:uncharacterized protein YwqG
VKLTEIPGLHLDALIDAYREAAAAHTAATDEGNFKKANRSYDLIAAVHRELGARGEPALRRLLPLMEDADNGVKTWAASHTLKFAPEQAESVLAAVAAGHGLCAFNAKMTLQEWRKGNLSSSQSSAASPQPKTAIPQPKTTRTISMNLAALMEAARESGVRDVDVAQLARPVAVLTPDARDSASRTPCSLGGVPLAPAGLEWPRRDGDPLAFVAQINLSSQPRSLVASGFPAGGTLLFFYDVESNRWGFDPEDAGSFAVIYLDAPDSAPVREIAWPEDLPEDSRYALVPLAVEETVSLPPWDSLLIDELELNGEQLTAYQNLLDRTVDDEEWSARCLVGGHPDQIQGDMTLECEHATAGLHSGDVAANQDARSSSSGRRPRDWRLLLQVPTLESAGMTWGSSGCLYYWIREDDLRSKRFDRTWMILQST